MISILVLSPAHISVTLAQISASFRMYT